MLARFILDLECQGRSPRTLELYRYIIGRFQGSGVSDPVVYLAGLNGRMALVTRRYHGRILRYYLGWCIKQGLAKANPLAGLHFSEPPLAAKRPFTQDEVRRLLAACRSPTETAMVVLLHDTGARASEATGLCGEDVDAEAGVLTIHGKGNKVRAVAVSSEALAAMRLCLNGRGKVFPELDRQKLYELLRRLGKRAGVAHVYPHRFRCTFAHEFLAAGGDIGNLRLIFGHATFAMSARYAAYYEAERAVAAHRRFLEAG